MSVSDSLGMLTGSKMLRDTASEGPSVYREPTLIEKLDNEEAELTKRLEDLTKLRNLLNANPDIHEILKLIGRRY